MTQLDSGSSARSSSPDSASQIRSASESAEQIRAPSGLKAQALTSEVLMLQFEQSLTRSGVKDPDRPAAGVVLGEADPPAVGTEGDVVEPPVAGQEAESSGEFFGVGHNKEAAGNLSRQEGAIHSDDLRHLASRLRGHPSAALTSAASRRSWRSLSASSIAGNSSRSSRRTCSASSVPSSPSAAGETGPPSSRRARRRISA